MDKSNRDFKSMLSKITEAVIDTSSPDFKHMLSKARDAAAGGINAMSKGEALAAALVLNRPDWLAAMNHTIAEAIDRIGPEWAILVPAVAKEFERDAQTAAYASAERTRLARHDELASRQQADNELDFSAKLITYGDSPGYRDVTFTFDLEPVGENQRPTVRASIRIRSEDGERIVEHITGVHRCAWDRSNGGRPIDAKPDEQRPRWIDKG
jgi:hypothetical protein